MKSRQIILSVIALCSLAALVACGGSSYQNTTTPPGITVALSGTPPASMAESASQSFTATVSNDSANAGVTWSVSCGSAACGSFSSTNTASGIATTYNAPPTIPAGSAVTLKATSVTDSGAKATASVNITIASSLADGSYVFSLAGQDMASSSYPYPTYHAVGVFTVASGVVTGGEQDYVDYAMLTLTDAITGGSVSTTADGSLQIVLNTADLSIGVAGVETLNGTLVSGTRGLINEFDAAATSSGELDLQTGAAALSGSYAFFLNGVDVMDCPWTTSGVLNVGAAGAISSTGSVFDMDDCGGTAQGQPVDIGSTVSAPDSMGRVEISLNLNTSGVGGIGIAGYIVDANRIRLVENNQDLDDVTQGVTGGTAFAQGANAGTFSTASVAGSSYVFGANGGDVNGYLQMAGVLTLNADGSVTGAVDFNDLTCTCTQIPVNVSGTYTVDATGRVTITGLTDAAALLGPINAELYLDGNGHGSLNTMDGTDAVAGLAYQQSGGGSFSASSLSGTYAFDTTGIGFALYAEFDSVGSATADGVSALNGTLDLNILFGSQTPGVPLTDGFTADPSGVFSATMTGLDNSNPSTTQAAFTYYVVDTTKVVAIQTDPNQLTLGYFELEQ